MQPTTLEASGPALIATEGMKLTKTCDIRTAEPFKGLFPIKKSVLTSIVMDMRRSGYDSCHPIIVWKHRNLVIDGHTRLEAALLLNLADVPVVERDFANEDEAVRYAIRCQRERRNLTDADIVRLVQELDKRRQKGERTDLASTEAKSAGKSAKETAKLIGTSCAKVEKVRTIKTKAAPKIKAAVESGEMTINAAYQTTRNPAPPEPDTENTVGAADAVHREAAGVQRLFNRTMKSLEECGQNVARFTQAQRTQLSTRLRDVLADLREATQDTLTSNPTLSVAALPLKESDGAAQ